MEQERRNLSERISNGQGKEPSSGPRGFIIGTFVQGLLKWGGKRVGGCWSERCGKTNGMNGSQGCRMCCLTPVPRFISIQEFVSCGRYYGQDLSPQQVNYVHYIQYIDRHLSMFYLVFSQPLLCFQMLRLTVVVTLEPASPHYIDPENLEQTLLSCLMSTTSTMKTGIV